MKRPAYMTDDMLAALVAWKAKHGRFWKTQLRKAWLDGTCSPELQKLRNTVGSVSTLNQLTDARLTEWQMDHDFVQLAIEKYGTDGTDVQVGGFCGGQPHVAHAEGENYAWVQAWVRVEIPDSEAV